MDSPSITEPLPGWFSVSVTVGLVTGALPALFGAVLAIVGSGLDLCGEFGDFGCLGFLVIGFYACPLGALVGGVVGGFSAARMAKDGTPHTRREVWHRSFGFGVLSLFLSGPISLTLLA